MHLKSNFDTIEGQFSCENCDVPIEFSIFNFAKLVAIFDWIFEIGAVQRNANLVDLEKCSKMSIYTPPFGGKKTASVLFSPQKRIFCWQDGLMFSMLDVQYVWCAVGLNLSMSRMLNIYECMLCTPWKGPPKLFFMCSMFQLKYMTYVENVWISIRP